MTSRPELRLDWCSHEAAKYAVERWHYSQCMPAGKTIKIGAWQSDVFVGCIIYSRGATPHIGSPYRLTQYQVCELTRVAFGAHSFQTSKALAFSMRMVARFFSGLRLIVSYADADQCHHGGIYQATNWIYTGLMNQGTRSAFVIHGKKVHPRTINAWGGVQSIEWVRKNKDPMATEFVTSGKHKYLMPLDDEMRARLAPLAKPYPKRAGSAASGTTDFQSVRGGATPTPALSDIKENDG
jgi:hypothetical protein